jgi:hypothetical protein
MLSDDCLIGDEGESKAPLAMQVWMNLKKVAAKSVEMGVSCEEGVMCRCNKVQLDWLLNKIA